MDLYSADVGQIQEGNMRTKSVMDANQAVKNHNDNVATAIDNLKSGQKTSNVLEATKDATASFWATGKIPSQVKAFQDWQSGGSKTNPVSQAQDTATAAVSESSTAPKTTTALTDVGDGVFESEGGLEATAAKTGELGGSIAGKIGAGLGVIGALGIGGLDTYKEISSLASGHGLAGDNWASKTADIGQIGGAIADIGATVFPPLALVGGALDLASGAIGEVGTFLDSEKQSKADTALKASQQESTVAVGGGPVEATGRVS